jgi:hypothetical protein
MIRVHKRTMQADQGRQIKVKAANIVLQEEQELQKGTLVIIRSKCEEGNELPGEPIGVDGFDSMVTRGIGVAGKEQTVCMAVNSAKPMNGWGRVVNCSFAGPKCDSEKYPVSVNFFQEVSCLVYFRKSY